MTGGASRILHDARLRAGLSQRALAGRARTSQSVVARIEAGLTSPSWDTLARLVAATGYAIDAQVVQRRAVAPGLSDVPRVRALDPAARLQELRNADRFLAAMQRVAR